jgi:hypothetical protein
MAVQARAPRRRVSGLSDADVPALGRAAANHGLRWHHDRTSHTSRPPRG